MTVPAGTITDLAKAFDTANVEMLAIALPDAAVTEASGAILRKWNCRREDLIGRKLVKFGTGPLSARYSDALAGQPQLVEVSYVPPLGFTRAITFNQQAWVDGENRYMVLIGQHASKDKADEAIQNERRLTLALRSGGFAAWDHDYRSGESRNSPEMYDLLGLPRDSSALNFKSFNDRVHPEDRDKTLDGQIMTAPFGHDMFQTRYRVRDETGAYTWIESIAGLLRDPADGRPEKCVGLSRNIGEQMAVVEKLQASERSLRRTQKAARLGSFSIALETGTTQLSSEMIALISMQSAIVEPDLAIFETMIEPADRERFREAIELAQIGRPVPAFEIAYKTMVEGELNHFLCNIEPEWDAADRVTAVFGTCQCITERKTLERKYLQAQKMEAVGQLTGGVAHDFNNLLMVVMGNLQLVEQLVKNDERAQKRIRAAIDAAEKGSELTRRMLAFSRQQTLQNLELSVDGLIERIHDILRRAVGGAVEVTVLPGTEVWPVKADRGMLETAILNLAINARDAMRPHGGKLIVETTNRHLDKAYCEENEDVQPGDYVEIAVTDTGCGIPPENIEKVFQPFFTTKGPEAGSGLGLSMIYGFAKQSGGHIKIYSEVGHGTTIRMYLPRHMKNEATLPDIAAVGVEPPLAPRRRSVVLVVEDNPSVRDVAAAMIEDMGFETIVAASGPDGLKAIEDRPDIDLVLSDVIMAGGMNGPELALKALQLRPGLKILFMSGYAPGSLRQMQELPNTIDLVNKPFTRNDLTEKVKRALAA